MRVFSLLPSFFVHPILIILLMSKGSQTEIGVKVYGSILFEIGRTNIQFGQGFGCLLAYSEKEEFYLCEFPAENFQPEYKSKSICFGLLGVTALLTEPLLAYASRILWKNELPTIEQATLIGAWSVKFAIDFNVSGIRGPIQIAKLCKNKTTNKIETHHFDQAGIATIMDRVKSLENHIQSFFQ
ncbi:hypothetical protein F1631_19615 [Leptospira interrogans serovar Yeoncheon]|nr:hypothetical protein [Leptospira interrogans serovar Yeoncheon]